ncbi:MAG: hypothetical protein ACLTG4_10130 [Oscillospiraceae bacterium]
MNSSRRWPMWTCCVDKTGTITEPTMEVTDVIRCRALQLRRYRKILAAFYHGEGPDNETAAPWPTVRRRQAHI